MLRHWILVGFLALESLLPAQRTDPGFQFGFGTSYDYGIDLPAIPGFQPYTNGHSGAFSFDCFVGIPLGRIAVYPSLIFSIPTRAMTIQNLSGDYLPQGYGISLPFSNNNPDVIDGENYYDLSAKADIWQRKIGAFALFHLGGGLEIGSGLFWKQKTINTFTKVLYDEYWYSGSTGTSTDDYAYESTYIDHVEADQFKDNSLAIPLVLQWRYQRGALYTGTSIIRWVGGGDSFWSFRYTMGFNF